MDSSQKVTDKAMMARCIELSRIAVSKGEYPFGTVIALDGQIVVEAINSTIRDGDVTRHAEVIALSEAQKVIGRKQLFRSTLYTNIEPCAMCSYCIREAQVGRVAYALGSPVMGGLSKWNILRDDGMSDRIPQIFGAVPEVLSGIRLHEAQQVWRDWNPLAWQMRTPVELSK
jgi:tRNA(adenine34) deaminase